MKIVLGFVGVIFAFALTSVALAQSKPATNAAVLEQLPFSDQQDFANVKRGFIAAIVGNPFK